ncbi:MAG TPA: acetate/propionate family kinase [Candidatus Limnocylindrales bacterium]|nr:acetate/propionate family kinase [Candidatus Limnocylindrales bacterium]
MRILTVNAGSSSLKLRLLGDGDELLAAEDPPRPDAGEEGDLEAVVARLGPIDAVGHRIVHGGSRFVEPVRIDPGVRRVLEELTDLAPLHQPASLAALDAVTAALPDVPAVACFDTAFHAGLPDAAATYALPRAWNERWGLRRYGFHGLSHAYAARRAAELLRRPVAGLRVVTCHLGSGASLAAVRDGRSVDTTMGFTPLEGLVMATRSGDVDPGLLLWLQERAGLEPAAMSAELESRAGLLGLSGTADMREVVARTAAHDPAAVLALGVYLHRLRGAIAAMVAALDGLDVLVFTGGVGEHAPEVRAGAVEGLGFLGLRIDPVRDREVKGDALISPPGTTVQVLVVSAREDIEIARGVRQALTA